MAIQYSDEQLIIIKGLMEICELFADQILHIMQNHGLDKVNGTCVKIEVDPAYSLVTKQLEFGRSLEADSGYIKLTRGLEEATYGATGKNSAEYEILFAPPEVAERIRKVLKRTANVPATSLLDDTDRSLPDVDRGVSVNDSVAES